MRFKAVILFILSVSTALCSVGQVKNQFTQSRILILLDESTSMLQRWAGGKEKHKISNELILKLMDSVWTVNDQVEFSLRVFGSEHTVPEHNCTDTKNEVPFTKQNRTQMEFRLEDIQPLGITSIAYSISEAAEHDLVDEDHNAYSIVLITDGGESCGGDICGVMEKLLRKKIFFRPYIISLEDVPELKTEYACMGNYLQVVKRTDVPVAIGVIVDAFRPMLKITNEDYKTLQKIGAPSVLKVNLPPIKTDIKDTTVAVVKMPIKTEPKPADTVAIKKPEPKPSKIIVGEAPKLPSPLKMSQLTVNKFKKLFAPAATTYRPKYIALPELNIPAPEPPATLPAPLKMTAATLRPLKKLHIDNITAYTPGKNVQIAYEVKVKAPEPEPLALVPVKMKSIAFSTPKKLSASKPTPYIPATFAITAPAIKLPEPEVLLIAPTPYQMKRIPASALKKIKTVKINTYSPETMLVTAPAIKIPEPEIVAIAPVPFKMQAPASPVMKKLIVKKTSTYIPGFVGVAAPVIKLPAPPPVVTEPVVARTKDILPKLKFHKFKMGLLYTGGNFFDTELKLVKLPPPPKFKPLLPVTPAVIAPPKSKTPNPAVNTAEYSVTQEDAKETILMVYITNGKGKYFPVTPQIILTDAVSGKEVKKFTRFVDQSGNPDPVNNLAAGKYYLTIPGREDLVASVDLLPNKRTRVEIVTKKYSISFYYNGAPKKPVNEFTAIVTQRNTTNGKVVAQKCSEKKEYEPGNYHIVINTFPEDVRNTDVDETIEGGIGIPQPGTARFTAEGKTTIVNLQKQDGNRFLTFNTLDLSKLGTQPLQIQPGKYQAVYSNGASKFSSSDRVVPFIIKSNEETTVILKN